MQPQLFTCKILRIYNWLIDYWLSSSHRTYRIIKYVPSSRMQFLVRTFHPVSPVTLILRTFENFINIRTSKNTLKIYSVWIFLKLLALIIFSLNIICLKPLIFLIKIMRIIWLNYFFVWITKIWAKTTTTWRTICRISLIRRSFP